MRPYNWIITFYLLCNSILVTFAFSEPANVRGGTITGSVTDKSTGKPLIGVNITIQDLRRGGVSDKDGKFTINNINPGTYTIVFEYIGYATQNIENISISSNSTTELPVVQLEERPIPLNEIIVTPGSYSIMGDVPSMRQTLTSEDIKMMGWAEDVTRAVQRIPGISANDFSAKFNIRGGDTEEVLVLLDGMQIYQPFHQKDFGGGLFSTIDIESLEGVNLMTGGFTAGYGDKMSGVLDMTTKSPKDNERQTSIGLSLMNVRLFSMGKFNQNKGSWLFSVRKGYLELLNTLMKNEFKLRPSYYDLLMKTTYRLSDSHSLGLHIFIADDSYKLDEKEKEPGKAVPNIDYTKSQYGNYYGWLTLNSILSDKLLAHTMLYAGNITKKRYWNRYDDDPVASLTIANIDDNRDFNLYGFKQDWTWQVWDKMLFNFGGNIKGLKVNYKYSNNIQYEYITAADSLDTYMGQYSKSKNVNGAQLGLYISNRLQIFNPLVMEVGLRYDYASYNNDKLWSPRINFVYSLAKNEFIRAGWGYYYQSQVIDQLGIQYQINNYYSAPLTKQYVLGYEKYLNNGLHFRTESYYKDISNLPDVFYTFANIDEFYPEAREDLFRVSTSKAKAMGIELSLKYDTGNKFSWWISYVLSEAKEYYTDIQYPGILTRKLGWQPRPWDQRHTINTDINYRLNNKWHFNLTWQYRSGWPYTPYEVKSKTREDGTYVFYHEFQTFNGDTYPAYHRMDLRINRYFYPSLGRVTIFLHIINIYNHENVYNYDHDIKNPYSADYKVERETETWFGFTPFIGFSLEF